MQMSLKQAKEVILLENLNIDYTWNEDVPLTQRLENPLSIIDVQLKKAKEVIEFFKPRKISEEEPPAQYAYCRIGRRTLSVYHVYDAFEDMRNSSNSKTRCYVTSDLDIVVDGDEWYWKGEYANYVTVIGYRQAMEMFNQLVQERSLGTDGLWREILS